MKAASGARLVAAGAASASAAAAAAAAVVGEPAQAGNYQSRWAAWHLSRSMMGKANAHPRPTALQSRV